MHPRGWQTSCARLRHRLETDFTTSLQLPTAVNEGLAAGQTIGHAHVHIYDYLHDTRSLLQVERGLPSNDGITGEMAGKPVQLYQGLPSNDVTAVAVDGNIAWVGGRGFVAVVDINKRKVLRIAYVSASRIYGIKLSPMHAWIGISCGKIDDPPYSGNARTGVYRIDRSTVEPAANAN